MIDVQKIKAIRKSVLDALFPIFCLGCREEGAWLCSACLGSIRTAPMCLCPGCGRFSAAGLTHGACAGRTPLSGIIALYPYANPLVRDAIKSYKYRQAMEIEGSLARLIAAGAAGKAPIFPSAAKVAAVPLHAARERERGFNQADRLARALAAALRLEMAAPLRRVRKTGEQAKLETAERLKNCRAAFASEAAAGDYILVDDVVTTGSTLREAALALKEAGAGRIYGFALAHG